jgi:hypothetical protein
VGLHAGHADGADTFALVHDGQPALDRQVVGELHHDGTILDEIFPELGGPSGHGRRTGLGRGDFGGQGAGAVHALEIEGIAGVVDDGEADVPLVFLGLVAAGADHLLHVGRGQRGLGAHGSSFVWPRPSQPGRGVESGVYAGGAYPRSARRGNRAFGSMRATVAFAMVRFRGGLPDAGAAESFVRR